MQSKNLSIAALICGILSIVSFFVFFYISPVLAIVAIVLGSKAQKLGKAAGEPTGMATAGLVTGIVGLSFTVLIIACVACVGAAAFAALGEMGGLEGFAELLQ